jgi:hypothetical protein
MPGFRLPRDDQRTLIFGRTGSGKTQYGAWLLSESAFHKRPTVIVDYKGDALLNSSPHIEEIALTDRLPSAPGLYIVHPKPDDDELVEAWFWSVWQRENIGLYIDEGYMVPDKGALRALLTQGRSKHIPAIILTQRPVWITRFAVSEADFYTAFHLNSDKDRKTVEAFLPHGALDMRLTKYHSRWYDVGEDTLLTVGPAPSADRITERFNERLRPTRRKI